MYKIHFREGTAESKASEVECVTCGNVFPNPDYYKMHMEQLLVNSCNQCDKAFCTKSGLTDHKKIHPEDSVENKPKSYKCQHCPQVFR